MTSATLRAYCKSHRVDELVVRREPRPEFTPSWHPFSHGEVLDAVGLAVKEAGFAVERREYSISAGAMMFGVWEINKQNADIRFAIGLRNSINKSMSVGLCAGERVFVCDNMVFSSEYVLFRKHTGRLDNEEIFLMAREALGAVIPKWERLAAWHEAMKGTELNAVQASLLTVAAMRRYVLPGPEFETWNALYYGTEEKPTKYTPTLHGWHGAVTETMNDGLLYRTADKQIRLNAFIDHEVPALLMASADRKFFTFDKVEIEATEKAKKAKEVQKAEARSLAEGFREKVAESRKEKKAQEEPKKDPEVPTTDEQLPKPDAFVAMAEKNKAARKARREEKKAPAPAPEGLAFPKPTSKKKKAPGQKAYDEKMAKGLRRTDRVKIRERIAGEAEDVKVHVQKAPKGERVGTARKKKAADEGEVYFCAKCAGEFPKPNLKKIGEDLLCQKCRA